MKDKIYHVQKVNQAARSMKEWMDGFNGVSTKYLQNYLSWFIVMGSQIGLKSVYLWIHGCLLKILNGPFPGEHLLR